MTAKGGAVHVKVPLARLSDYGFAYGRDRVSWRIPGRKIVLDVKGFTVEQHTEGKTFHVVFKRARSESRLPRVKKLSRIRQIFSERSSRVIQELQALDEGTLAQAVRAPDDFGVLLSALQTEAASAGVRARDPLAGARLRGLEAKRKLIDAEGGALSSAEGARLLGDTRQALDKRRRKGRLVALELGRKGFTIRPGNSAWRILSLSSLRSKAGTPGSS